MILERGGLRISREMISVDGIGFPPSDVEDVDVASEVSSPSLAWLLYGSLAALAAFNASSARETALWPIAGALLVLAHISWRRRRPQPRYRVMLKISGARTTVLETRSPADANLVRDAISMALPAIARI